MMQQNDNFSTRRGRRWFLGVAGGSLALAHFLQRGIGRAQGTPVPKRLMILHRPNGTIREDWIRNGQRGPILEPFAPVWANAVALKGMDIRPGNNGAGADPHGKGTTTVMTGAHLSPKTPPGSDDGKWNTKESLDQIWSRDSDVLKGTPVPNIHIGANGVMEGLQEPQNRTLSFAGPEQPLYPVINPYDVYKRVFGDTILPGGDADAKAKALARLRLRRETALTLVKGDLARVKQQIPAAFRADLEAHETADETSGGKLIDNTLVWYINECAVGWNHNQEDMPFVLFGGDGVGLKNRGRIADVSGTTSNDVWLSMAPHFGMPQVTSFETDFTGPIPGLFG